MQVVQPAGIAVGQGARQKVGLFLIVDFQRYPVSRPNDAVQQSLQITGADNLAVAVCRTCGQPLGLGPATGVPRHNQCTELIADWITAVTASGWEISVRCDPPL